MTAYSDTKPDDSVVHLVMRYREEVLSIGTGVLYQRDARYFLVTAWHNLTGRHSETLTPISKTCALPNNVIASISNVRTVERPEEKSRIPYTIEIERGDDTLYWIHPSGWPRVDVAVIPLDLNESHKVEAYLRGKKIEAHRTITNPQSIQECLGPIAEIPGEQKSIIHTGDELFVLGYPRGISDRKKSPIWKRATVASDPCAGWEGEQKFLVDCASREGMSGAPVIAFFKNRVIPTDEAIYIGTSNAALLGIYVGRILDNKSPASDQFFEAQIGTVWKRQVIDDIIDAHTSPQKSSQLGAGHTDIKSAVRNVCPIDPNYYRKVEPDPPFISYWVREVMIYLGGNANPSNVEAIIRSHVEEFQKSASSSITSK